MKLGEEKFLLLSDMAFEIRRLSMEMITYSSWGHIGGAFSMAEILSVLYFHEMNTDPGNPGAENRDRLILSKAHASPALYAALTLRGYFPVSKIYEYCRPGGLEGHTHINCAPGIESSGGPLGMGLSVAAGMAMGLMYKENVRSRVYCILGDGECNEGNVWEAAMSASHYHLDNLIAIVDYNKVMAKGMVSRMMSLEPFSDKWKAFGWNVLETDGHNIEEVADALYRARWINVNGKPSAIIAHTVKGKGIERAEFNSKWHTHAPDPQTADSMIRELCRNYNKPESGYSRINDHPEENSFYGGE